MTESFARRAAGLLLISLTAVLALVVAAWLSEWENVLAARRSVRPSGVVVMRRMPDRVSRPHSVARVHIGASRKCEPGSVC